ncbi:MAG: AAA family ATPase [Candidatus Micrarchaeota archaeon]|nr:AAA family ATPase [Candidatus Micrarchaeota archaeon]
MAKKKQTPLHRARASRAAPAEHERREKTPAEAAPAGESPKVKSGIPGLDRLIGGGFERESVVLVTGDAGSGKSTLAMQFLCNGASQYDEPGILITFEERREDIIKHMKSYGWDIEALEKEKKIKILEYPPHEVERFISEGEIIRDLISDLKAKRMVIDSMTSFALVFDNEYKMRLGVLKAIDSLKKWGCTALLISEGSVTEQGEVRDRFGIEYLVDGTIYLYNKRVRDYRQKLVEIVELKGVKHDNAIHQLVFGRKGISVEERSA